MRVTDPLLASLGHCDPHPAVLGVPVAAAAVSSRSSCASIPVAVAEHKPFAGRFHACERRWKCDDVWQGGVGCFEWDEEYLDQIGKGLKKLVRPFTAGDDETEQGTCAGDGEGPLVVNVNPAEMPEWCWEEYRPEKEREILTWVESRRHRHWGEVGPSRRLQTGSHAEDSVTAVPNSLVRIRASCPAFHPTRTPSADRRLFGREQVVPLARHSSRPELQDFVALFRPRTVYPLTCTNPELFKLLPVIFDERHLAPGGVDLQRAEVARHTAEWYSKAGTRKRLTAMFNTGTFATAYGFPSHIGNNDAIGAEDKGAEESAVGLRMSKTNEMALAKGLNIEGDERIVEEHLRWLQKSSAWHAFGGEALDASGGSASEPVRADVIVLSDSDDEGDTRPRAGDSDFARAVNSPPRPASASTAPVYTDTPCRTCSGSVPDAVLSLVGPRELEFHSHSSGASRRVSRLGKALALPVARRPCSNRMPSPFLAAAHSAVCDEERVPDLTGGDENMDVLKSPIRLEDRLVLGCSTSTCTSTTADSVAVRVCTERLVTPSPVLGLSLPPSRQPLSRPRCTSVVLSNSTDLLNVDDSDAGHAAAFHLASPTDLGSPDLHCTAGESRDYPAGKKRSRAATSPPVFPEPSMSKVVARDLAAFYRRWRGKIGAGGKLVYFDVGDPRLQGRSSIKAAMAAKAAAVHPQKEPDASVISPKSFRTVSASISISPRA